MDTALATFEAVRTVLAIMAPDATYQGATMSRSEDIGIGLSLLALETAAAVEGFSRVNDCKAALAEPIPEWPPRPKKRRRARLTPQNLPAVPGPSNSAGPSIPSLPVDSAPPPVGTPVDVLPAPSSSDSESDAGPPPPAALPPPAPKPVLPRVPQIVDPE